MTAAAAPNLEGILPEGQWREHYADLAAAWIREHGTLPPSLEALAEWGAEPTGASLDDEVACLEGRGPDPNPCR